MPVTRVAWRGAELVRVEREGGELLVPLKNWVAALGGDVHTERSVAEESLDVAEHATSAEALQLPSGERKLLLPLDDACRWADEHHAGQLARARLAFLRPRPFPAFLPSAEELAAAAALDGEGLGARV